MDHDYQVYIIHSTWSLTRLDEFISRYGEVGFLRVMYDVNGDETNKSIAIISKESVDRLNAVLSMKKFREVVIYKYLLTPRNFPNSIYQSSHSLFVPIPKALNAKEADVIKAIESKLAVIASWNIIPVGSWKYDVSINSRSEGKVGSGCYITFSDTTDVKAIALCRVLLNDTYWPEENVQNTIFRCYWTRLSAKKEPTPLKELPSLIARPEQIEIVPAKVLQTVPAQ